MPTERALKAELSRPWGSQPPGSGHAKAAGRGRSASYVTGRPSKASGLQSAGFIESRLVKAGARA